MEWYWILLIAYGVLIFLNTLDIYIFKTKHKGLDDILVFPIIFLIGVLITPFLWIISFAYFIGNRASNSETFTIHKLTEENKIALRELGFSEGSFVSAENISYQGFRNLSQGIRILYNGRVSIRYKYTLSRKQKFLIKQIKSLKDPHKKIANLEGAIENKKHYIKSEKKYKKRYEERINKYKEEIKEAKQELEQLREKYKNTVDDFKKE